MCLVAQRLNYFFLRFDRIHIHLTAPRMYSVFFGKEIFWIFSAQSPSDRVLILVRSISCVAVRFGGWVGTKEGLWLLALVWLQGFLLLPIRLCRWRLSGRLFRLKLKNENRRVTTQGPMPIQNFYSSLFDFLYHFSSVTCRCLVRSLSMWLW